MDAGAKWLKTGKEDLELYTTSSPAFDGAMRSCTSDEKVKAVPAEGERADAAEAQPGGEVAFTARSPASSSSGPGMAAPIASLYGS
jgi:hypothetical protein